MEIPLLGDVIVIFGLSIAVLLIFHRLKAPTIVGFLITGILAGPHGFGIVRVVEEVSALAEIGVVLLLFTVGLEISLKDMLRLKRYVLFGGTFQVFLTTVAVFAILNLRGFGDGDSILFGFLIALSSTAIVLRIIQERGEFDTLHGRTTLGILIFQDVIVIPMMLIIPWLPGASGDATGSPLALAAKAVLALVLVIFSASWAIPKLLYLIAKTKDRELFLLSVVAICFSVAWATFQAGLSLGLGAFLAGLIISESEYSHHTIGNIIPLRDAFASFFFVSIGMLLDLSYLAERPLFILMLAFAVMALKSTMAGLTILAMGLPARVAVLVGLGLSQVGEFSFILSKVGLENGLLSSETYQIFLDVTVLTMGASSIVAAAAPHVAAGIHRLPLPADMGRRDHPADLRGEEALKDHLIIVGFGVNGRNVARAAGAAGIPFLVVEMDPDIFRAEQKRGVPIFYGDAAKEAVLGRAGIEDAKVMVIAISDPSATRRITTITKKLNPEIYLIVRTRYIRESRILHELGADQIIPEEFETSVEIFALVLERYAVPGKEIQRFISDIRSDEYAIFRRAARDEYCGAEVDLISTRISTFRVGEGSRIVGLPLPLDDLKTQGIEIMAVHRGSGTLVPEEGNKLEAGDVVFLRALPDKIASAAQLFEDALES